ncbi:MAG: hypothetical protein O2856_12205, partial [Planctomycetota bacterium]|nr:hypothetical protein [Planctomycetota bacterium]
LASVSFREQAGSKQTTEETEYYLNQLEGKDSIQLFRQVGYRDSEVVIGAIRGIYIRQRGMVIDIRLKPAPILMGNSMTLHVSDIASIAKLDHEREDEEARRRDDDDWYDDD